MVILSLVSLPQVSSLPGITVRLALASVSTLRGIGRHRERQVLTVELAITTPSGGLPSYLRGTLNIATVGRWPGLRST